MKDVFLRIFILIILPLVVLFHWAKHPTIRNLVTQPNVVVSQWSSSKNESPVPIENSSSNILSISKAISQEVAPIIAADQDLLIPDFDRMVPELASCTKFFPNIESVFHLCAIPSPVQKVVSVVLKFKNYLEKQKELFQNVRVLLVDDSDDGYHRHLSNFLLYPAYFHRLRLGDEDFWLVVERGQFTHILVLDITKKTFERTGSLLKPLNAYKIDFTKHEINQCWQY